MRGFLGFRDSLTHNARRPAASAATANNPSLSARNGLLAEEGERESALPNNPFERIIRKQEGYRRAQHTSAQRANHQILFIFDSSNDDAPITHCKTDGSASRGRKPRRRRVISRKSSVFTMGRVVVLLQADVSSCIVLSD